MLKLNQIDNHKNYLITGAAGFIGFHLSKYLLENGCHVIGIDNLNDYYEVSLKESRLSILKKYINFNFLKTNIDCRDNLNKIFEDFKPDIIINLAAQAGVRYSIENPDAYISSNIIGFYNILECCRKYSIKHLIYASSSSVYGANKKVPFSVDDKVDNPVSLYAATKKSNELMAYTYSHLYKFPVTGLRFFTVYGPYGRPDMAYFSFTKKILNNQSIKVFNNGDMYRDFTYIDDVVEGIVRLLNYYPKQNKDGVKYKIYNIGNNKPEKLMYFIETLEKCIDKKAIMEFYPMQPGDVPKTYADVNDLINDIDFKPNTSIRDGLKKFIEWYRDYYYEL